MGPVTTNGEIVAFGGCWAVVSAPNVKDESLEEVAGGMNRDGLLPGESETIVSSDRTGDVGCQSPIPGVLGTIEADAEGESAVKADDEPVDGECCETAFGPAADILGIKRDNTH